MPTGLTKGAGWEIGLSRTLPLPHSAVWDFLTGDEGVGLWLGPGAHLPEEKGQPYETADGIRGELRSRRPGDRVRLTYNGTTVQVAVTAAGPGKSVLRFHQERLSSAAEREERRAHWRAVMERVTKALVPEGS